MHDVSSDTMATDFVVPVEFPKIHAYIIHIIHAYIQYIGYIQKIVTRAQCL